MSSIVKPLVVPFLAGAAITKGTAVKLSSGNVIECTANTDKAIGICQNEVAASGDVAEVAMNGNGALALAAENIAAGKSLVPGAAGSMHQVNAAGDKIIAIALESAVAGDLFSVMVCHSVAAAADE